MCVYTYIHSIIYYLSAIAIYEYDLTWVIWNESAASRTEGIQLGSYAKRNGGNDYCDEVKGAKLVGQTGKTNGLSDFCMGEISVVYGWEMCARGEKCYTVSLRWNRCKRTLEKKEKEKKSPENNEDNVFVALYYHTPFNNSFQTRVTFYVFVGRVFMMSIRFFFFFFCTSATFLPPHDKWNNWTRNNKSSVVPTTAVCIAACTRKFSTKEIFGARARAIAVAKSVLTEERTTHARGRV